MTKFLFFIETEMLKKLKAEAKRLEVSVGALIRNIVEDYFK
jgi:hypothetical protein